MPMFLYSITPVENQWFNCGLVKQSLNGVGLLRFAEYLPSLCRLSTLHLVEPRLQPGCLLVHRDHHTVPCLCFWLNWKSAKSKNLVCVWCSRRTSRQPGYKRGCNRWRSKSPAQLTLYLLFLSCFFSSFHSLLSSSSSSSPSTLLATSFW